MGNQHVIAINHITLISMRRVHLHDIAVRQKQRDFSLFQLTVYTKTMKTPGKTETFENKDLLSGDFKNGDFENGVLHRV